MRLFHITDENGAGRIEDEGFLPRVGPRSAMLGERPAVFFFKDRSFAEDAVCGWLGDLFPPETNLFCLEVEVPEGFPLSEDPNFGDIESFSTVPVPAKYLLARTAV